MLERAGLYPVDGGAEYLQILQLHAEFQEVLSPYALTDQFTDRERAE